MKLIPNKTNEQILKEYFKYFDLESLGLCNLQNFIKTNERLGLVYKKSTDLEKIFNYFDKDKDGYINYKNFSREIFSMFNPNKNIQPINFISILINKLNEKNGNLAFLKLIKSFKIIDYNNTKKLTIDDFLKVLNECHLNFNSFEMQYLFQEYDLFINGVVLYYKIIEILINNYWNERRYSFSKDFYNFLTEEGNKNVSFNDLRNFFINNCNDDMEKQFFSDFFDCYKFITFSNNNNYISLNDIILFVKCFGFGIESDYELKDLLFKLDKQNNINSKNENYQLKNNKEKIKGYNNNNNFNFKKYENNIKNKVENILNILRKYLVKYGRNCLFNFIKHFKYYDNNTKTINKYDFLKVLKDFNINIPLIDIENIFYEFGLNNNKDSLNYFVFLKKITEPFMTQSRINLIEKIYDKLNEISNEKNYPLNIKLMKELYNPKNNYFISDEEENKIDFENCLELYHNFYKGIKNDNFSKNEFFEFYSFISYLIENDYIFTSLLNNEWNKLNIDKEQILLNKNDFNFTFGKNNKNQEILFNNKEEKEKNEEENLENLSTKNHPRTNYYNNEKSVFENEDNNYNNILEQLKQKLRIRGIRGLLYLHKQFLLSCPNLMRISYNDFINILKGQHLFFNENEYKILFNSFSYDNYLLFSKFIREFKKKLNENKLNEVNNIFSILDLENTGNVNINQIKMNFDAKNHPEVISGKKTEEEILLEFIDSFQINNYILNYGNNNENNIIDFEIFANFYEYVAFVYENDNEFKNIVNSTFHE